MKTEILYEDNDIFVVHKMAGMATQSASVSQMDVESELRNYGKGKELYVVHRLDQPVEGILVFARTKPAAAALSRQVQEKGIMGKTYQALVCGKVVPESAELVDYLIKGKNGLGQVVSEQQRTLPQFREAKRAVLSYHLLEYRDDTDVSLLEISLGTGRFHQIRLQLSHAGFPIVGDRKYGGEVAAQKAKQLGIRYTALCASQLELVHPINHQKMCFSIPVSYS